MANDQNRPITISGQDDFTPTLPTSVHQMNEQPIVPAQQLAALVNSSNLPNADKEGLIYNILHRDDRIERQAYSITEFQNQRRRSPINRSRANSQDRLVGGEQMQLDEVRPQAIPRSSGQTILPPTKGLKTKAKNLVEKLVHLRI